MAVSERLSHRQRVFATLEHKNPDRVPLDALWVRLDTWAALKRYLETDDDDVVRERLGLDFRFVTTDPSKKFMEEARLLYPHGCYKPLSGGLFEDEWGIKYEPTKSGLHWRYVYHPLEQVEDPDEYDFPQVDAPGRFDEAARVVRCEGSEFIIEANLAQTLYEWAWALRGFKQFCRDLFGNHRFVNKLLDRLLKFRMECGRRFIELGVDIIQLGDDVGMQTGMMISPSLWRRFFKPRMKALIGDLMKRSHKRVHIFYHSDGNIEPIIPELIELGIGILNPIQPEAMDPAKIKRMYGDKLVLHGTISVQRTLPLGTAEDVKQEVFSRIRTCGQNGGLIIAPAHTPQPPPYTSVHNVVAIFDTARAVAMS